MTKSTFSVSIAHANTLIERINVLSRERRKFEDLSICKEVSTAEGIEEIKHQVEPTLKRFNNFLLYDQQSKESLLLIKQAIAETYSASKVPKLTAERAELYRWIEADTKLLKTFEDFNERSCLDDEQVSQDLYLFCLHKRMKRETDVVLVDLSDRIEALLTNICNFKRRAHQITDKLNEIEHNTKINVQFYPYFAEYLGL